MALIRFSGGNSCSGSSSDSSGTVNRMSRLRRRLMLINRAKQRANLSFYLVVVFFVTLLMIAITEILYIDQWRDAIVDDPDAIVDDAANSLIAKRLTDAMAGSDLLMAANDEAAAADKSDDDFRNYMNRFRNPFVPNISGGGAPFWLNHPQLFSNQGHHQPQQEPDETLPIKTIDIPLKTTVRIPATDAVWQSVNGTKKKFFVYSAYYDNRTAKSRVRIIGASRTKNPEKVFCILWYHHQQQQQQQNTNHSSNHSSSSDTVTTPMQPEPEPSVVQYRIVKGVVQRIREHWNLEYSACFIICPVDVPTVEGAGGLPASVSLVGQLNATITNHLVVHSNHSDNLDSGLGVCVKPLHYNYNNWTLFLEFIEYHRIVGADHFTFYNHSIGAELSCLMEDYVQRGLITLLPWQLNLKSQTQIRTEGLLASLNDCLYRYMYRHPLIALIDLDEFIVPRPNTTLPELIENIHRTTPQTTARHIGAYSFRNAFFYLQWTDEKSAGPLLRDPIVSKLVSVCKTRRRQSIHPHKQRSKYICRPELAVEVGNHFVWELLPLYRTWNVPQNVSLLHHYRICEFGGDQCTKQPSVVDESMRKYWPALSVAVKQQYQRLRNKCGL